MFKTIKERNRLLSEISDNTTAMLFHLKKITSKEKKEKE